jgi:hypothetical protein
MSRDEQERLRDIQDANVAIRSHLAQAGEKTAPKLGGAPTSCVHSRSAAAIRSSLHVSGGVW